MNRRIWRSTDTQKPCMCSFWAPTTTKSYKMSPQMPLFIPISSKISANNNNLSCSILRRRRTCSISTSTSTLSLATTKIHRMSPQMPLSFLPFLKRGSIKSKDKNGSMNNWTIILDYSLTDKNMELKMWRKKNQVARAKKLNLLPQLHDEGLNVGNFPLLIHTWMDANKNFPIFCKKFQELVKSVAWHAAWRLVARLGAFVQIVGSHCTRPPILPSWPASPIM